MADMVGDALGQNNNQTKLKRLHHHASTQNKSMYLQGLNIPISIG